MKQITTLATAILLTMGLAATPALAGENPCAMKQNPCSMKNHD